MDVRVRGVFELLGHKVARIRGGELLDLSDRRQLRHPVYTKPELLATGPNQVWSWDTTKGRRAVLNAAYAAHPERFVRKPPEPLAPPTAAWINPPAPSAFTEAPH
jgi:hypothetical protein